jgi:hypothetical protein
MHASICGLFTGELPEFQPVQRVYPRHWQRRQDRRALGSQVPYAKRSTYLAPFSDLVYRQHPTGFTDVPYSILWVDPLINIQLFSV